MSSALTSKPTAEAIERVVVGGDLSKLSADERVNYYRLVCESVGLNPLTKPFEYITLNGKLTLYARKDATDQLRQNHVVSITIVGRESVDGCYVVTARATLPNGRTDESIGAVPIENQKGEVRANSMMKCETKAKRRVTLSICGLGMLDELEVETIPNARPASFDVPRTTEPIPISSPRNERAAESSTVKGTAEPLKTAEPVEAPVQEPHTALGDALLRTMGREPGDDSADECIDLPRQRALHRAFKDAIFNPETAKKADSLFREWLKEKGYVDADNKGTTKTIPMLMFEEVKAEAVKYAEKV